MESAKRSPIYKKSAWTVHSKPMPLVGGASAACRWHDNVASQQKKIGLKKHSTGEERGFAKMFAKALSWFLLFRNCQGSAKTARLRKRIDSQRLVSDCFTASV